MVNLLVAQLRVTAFNQAVTVVGSMLSADIGSNLPNGAMVSAELLDRLLAPLALADPSLKITPERIERIRDIARDAPFEQLLNHYPSDSHIQESIKAEYENAPLNPFHESLAKAAVQGHIHHIITTNYDTCLERALRKAGQPINVVILERDAHFAEPDNPHVTIVFKIHGCVTHPSTLVYRLSSEGALPNWKRQLLGALVNSRDMLILGYSGRDFDVFPCLVNQKYKRFLWASPTNNPKIDLKNASQNFRHLFHSELTSKNAIVIPGGFNEVLPSPRPFEV